MILNRNIDGKIAKQYKNEDFYLKRKSSKLP